ncbi:MAG: hypothetical protein JWM27_2368 [Gemmatimonadetes bacterium]|nr:hypothetical protein [Gemmatimonadota bacterium]
MDHAHLTDRQIAERISERSLEEHYLRELLASMGFDPGEGWTGAAIAALETATHAQRRHAALRTIALDG